MKTLCLLLCFTLLGCTEDYIFDSTSIVPITTTTTTITPASLSSVQTATGTMLTALRTNPNSFMVTEYGIQMAKLYNNTGNAALNYMNGMRILKPVTILPDVDLTTLRATIVTDLNKFQFSQTFKVNLMSSFDYMRTIRTQTFAQFETYFENKLSNISATSYITISTLTELEKFALTQAYYSVLNLTRWIYQHPASSSLTGQCLPAGKEEWINVAEYAFFGGLGMGATWAHAGAAAGAIATAPAGAPVVGGVVGGVVGFVLGFTLGATGGAIGKVLWHCLSNKLFTIKRKIICSGTVAYTYSVEAPMGCSLMYPGGPSLKDVVKMGLVPNKGKTAIAASVNSNINYLLKYL